MPGPALSCVGTHCNAMKRKYRLGSYLCFRLCCVLVFGHEKYYNIMNFSGCASSMQRKACTFASYCELAFIVPQVKNVQSPKLSCPWPSVYGRLVVSYKGETDLQFDFFFLAVCVCIPSPTSLDLVGTIFPRNITLVRFYFKALFGVATVQWWLDFKGGVYQCSPQDFMKG